MLEKASAPLVVTVNSTGRQSAALVRVASAIGWRVRAQFFDATSPVLDELRSLRNVTVTQGTLTDPKFVQELFTGADYAFVNTLHWDDEVAIGCICADAAKRAKIKHYVYSSMPDHSTFGQGWRALPLWAQKYTIEKYVRSLEIPATFVYAGIYNNNFTSLAYPLFRLELQSDKSFLWKAPFHPEDPLPWLDVEHDFGPAVLQIFKEGPERWAGHRIPIAFQKLSPVEACRALSEGLDRPVRYEQGPIEILVPVPQGYQDQLDALAETLGRDRAAYFGPTMYYPNEAITLWEGNRGLEEYAREVFPEEERNNGLMWMEDDESEDNNDDDRSASGNAEASLTNQEIRLEAENSYGGSC